MQGFKVWIEAIEDFGALAKRSLRLKSADAFPKVPTNVGTVSKSDFGDKVDSGRQPLDSVDVDKATKVKLHANLFVPLYHMSDKVPANKIQFDFVGTQDRGVMYWVDRIQKGDRPAILVGSLYGGKSRGVIGLAVLDGNHRATAYHILKIPEIPVIISKGAKAYLRSMVSAAG